MEGCIHDYLLPCEDCGRCRKDSIKEIEDDIKTEIDYDNDIDPPFDLL